MSAVELKATTENALSDLQQTVAHKLGTTLREIVKEVLNSLVAHTKIAPQEFVDKVITPKQAELALVDERTNHFFRKMLVAINEEFNRPPFGAFYDKAFAQLAAAVNDQQLRNKCIEGFALPFVKALVVDLDSIKPAIVDDIINS